MVFFSKSFRHPFSLTLFYSFSAHAVFFLGLLILSLIPLQKRDRIIRAQAAQLQIREPVRQENKQEARKGEQRILDPENVQPTPPPTPVPTPRPTPAPTPEPKKIVVPPKTTPKILEKKAEQKKQAIETPRPTPAPKASPVPVLTPRPEVAKKQPVLTPAPTPAPKRPAVTPKGDKAGTLAPPSLPPLAPAFEADDVSLDYNYVQDATHRLSANFVIPGHLPRQTRLPSCVIQFRIHRTGTIDSITVIESTGNPMLDQLAKDAVIRTGRLLPLPDDITQNVITAKMRFSFRRE